MGPQSLRHESLEIKIVEKERKANVYSNETTNAGNALMYMHLHYFYLKKKKPHNSKAICPWDFM